ncbi:MAG: aldehyde dehydrogenase family protein [Acidimicrobiia bacterium]|nr:aldehyde dehydrogenase family protein [Acidimicrobiia bacterium]
MRPGALLRTDAARPAGRLFEAVRAGTVWGNGPLTDNFAGPFGGLKAGGNARELGERNREGFLESEHVRWDFEDAPNGWWHPC